MITKETIDKIFSTVRVEEIVGEYVQLKRAGSNYKGLSPFVDEKTPSFIVSPSKQIWKDFSSGKGGTAISFLMEIENFSYPEALRYVAKKYGIEVEEHKRELTEEEKNAQNEKDLLYKIHEIANHYFQEQLWEDQEGRTIGLSYFKERELREDIIKKFQLGYSPIQKNAFTSYALSQGYNKELLQKSGLSIFSDYAPEGVDRFRERVIFPILSFSGRVLGFGGRILKNNVKAAKYLNSPETEIYHKSNVLYGLSQSKQAISKHNLCLLVEGYMDVIALHQVGVENVVASSGTALTVEQIKLIKRLTENVTILFDGDAAGIKASFRSIDLLLSQGMNIRIVLFPDGDDPDSFSRKHSREEVEQFIAEQAQDFIDFKAEILLKEAHHDPIKKAEAIRDIVKSVAFIENVLKQEIYLKEISNKFGLSEQSLFNELGVQYQIKEQSAPRQSPQSQETTKLKPLSTPEPQTALLYLEEQLVDIMLKYGPQVIELKSIENKNYQTTVIEEIISSVYQDECEIQSPINKKIIEEIKQGLDENELRTDLFFRTLMDADITEKIAHSLIEPHHLSDWSKHNIYLKPKEHSVSKLVKDTIYRYKREYVLNMIQQLKAKETEDKTEIYKKIIKLTQIKNKLDQELYRVV